MMISSIGRRVLAAGGFALAAGAALGGEQITEVTFSFNAADLSIRQEQGFDAVTMLGCTLPEDEPGTPELPARYANILVPSDAQVQEVSAQLVHESLVATGITPPPVQPPAPLSLPRPAFVEPDPKAYAATAKKALFRAGSAQVLRGMKYVPVRLNPVRVVPATGDLYLAGEILMTVTHSAADGGVATTSSASATGDTPQPFRRTVAKLVANPEALADTGFRVADAPLNQTYDGGNCDYLVITNNTLATAFQALADHRASHNSYSTEVKTVSSITAEYAGADTQAKIRNCIIDYVENAGTVYVVLGGDNTVVPDRDCRVAASGNVTNNMPTDLYYAGLDGNWDTDGDGVYGETEDESASGTDEADLAADVYVGRIPVRTTAQADAYINKLIEYETTPGVAEGIARKYLMTGVETFKMYSGGDRPTDTVPDGHLQFTEHNPVCDAEVTLRRQYRDAVHPWWRADTVGLLFDTLTSWDGGTPGDYAASPSHMVNRFNEGWAMVTNGTHGHGGTLVAENHSFDTSDAAALTGLTPFFYTYACYTGMFDNFEPSLSEAMLRNGNGGALLYIGSSRFNYSGTGYRYQEEFLRVVFEDHTTNVGEAFYNHKASFAAESDNNSSKRWLQFSLNLQGDPAVEMILSDGTNSAPIAHDQSLSVSDTVGIVLQGTDWDEDSLTYTRTSDPAHGTITGTPPNLTYEPDAGYIGNDSFTFTVNDGTVDSDPATVSISVTPALTAYWPLDEMDGLYLPDETGNGYRMSFSQDEFADGEGVFGNAARLHEDNGPIKNSYPKLPFTGAEDASLALWFNCDNAHDVSRYQVLFDLGGEYSAENADPEQNIIAYVHGLKLYVIVNGAQFSTSAIQEDTWHHLVLALQVEEGTGNGAYKVYLDGAKVGEGSYPAGKEITEGYLQFGLPSYQAYYHDQGPFYEHGVNWFGGMLDDIRFYSREIDGDLVYNLSETPRSLEDTYTTTEDTALNVPAPGVLANDVSPREHPLDAVLIQDAAHGTLTLYADGGFDYTPDEDFVGTDTFTYRATDGAIQGDATTVTLTVNLPDPWRNADIGMPDPSGGAHYDDGSGGLVVDGPPGDFGSTSDGGHFVYRTLFGDGQIVARVVSQENTDASAKAGVMMRETVDGGSRHAFMGITPGEGAAFVTRDTTDGGSSETTAGTHTAPHWVKLVRSGNTLTGYESADGTVWNQVGTATVAMNNELHVGLAAGSNVAGEHSTVEFDGIDTTASVDAVDDAYTTDEDVALDTAAGNLLANDDGLALTAALDSSPAHGTATVNPDGTFTYTPDKNYHGADSFTYTATDAQANTDTATVTITLTPVNDAPVGVEDEYVTPVNTTLTVDAANGVLVNDSDAEGDPLTASFKYDSNGTANLNADGSFTFEPDTDFLGTASFYYKLEDDQGNFDFSVRVTINVGGYPPVADCGDGGTGGITVVDDDNDGFGTIHLDGTASSDQDGTIVAYNWSSSDLDPPFSIDSATGQVEVAVGEEPYFHLEVTDNDGLTQTRGVRYYIVNENDAPTANPDSYTTDEDTPLNVTAPGLLDNDTEPDPQLLTAQLQTNPAYGNVEINRDGSFDYVPQPGFYGADSFTYTAFDGELHSAPATVTITVDYTDADADHVPDDWEQQIIDAAPDDDIDSVDDVLPGDDFDGDGRTNFEEYAFCLDPLSGVEPNQQQTSLANDAGMPVLDVTIHLRSDDANLSYTVETCTDLAAGDWTGGALTHTGGTWSSAHAPVTVVSQTEESSGVWSVTLRLPVNDTAGFLRTSAQ